MGVIIGAVPPTYRSVRFFRKSVGRGKLKTRNFRKWSMIRETASCPTLAFFWRQWASTKGSARDFVLGRFL
jgi:hypothetical protein